jgi:MFS family permease
LGGIVTAATAAVYLWASSLAILIPVRLFQGLALASFYTSSSTLVADLAPDERRGEALSYFSMFLYVGLAAGPALGLALESVAGFHAVFGVSTGLAVGCAAIAGLLREPPLCAPEAIEIERRPLVNRAVLFPAGVLMLAAFGYGAGINFTADFARQAGIGGRSSYFPVLAGTVIAIRFLSGRASDRFGRIRVAVPGLALFAAAMAMESAAHSTGPLLVSAVLFGAGFGMFYPSMMALAVDLVRPHERGSAMATFTSAFDIGFGVGSPVLGAISGASGYPTMYAVAALFAVASLAALLVGTAWRGGALGLVRRRRPTPQPR